MLTTSASNVGMSETARSINVSTYTRLLASIEVFNCTHWPTVENAIYGEDEFRFLCEKLHIDERQSILGFREYRDTPDNRRCVPVGLQPLKAAIDTYVVSTAECERSFSLMNDIWTATRNSLTTPRVSDLVFIKAVGPPLSRFDLTDYVKTWIKRGRRTADETCCPAPLKRALDHDSYEHLWNVLWTIVIITT